MVSLLRFSLRPASSLLPRITGVWFVVVAVVEEGLQEKSDAAVDVLSKLCDDGGMCTGDRDPEQCDAGDKFLELSDAGDTFLELCDAGDRFLEFCDAGDTFLELSDAGDNFPELCDDKDKVPEACVVSELSEEAGEVVSMI